MGFCMVLTGSIGMLYNIYILMMMMMMMMMTMTMTMTMTTNPNCDNSSVMIEISSQRMTADGSNDDNNNDK